MGLIPSVCYIIPSPSVEYFWVNTARGNKLCQRLNWGDHLLYQLLLQLLQSLSVMLFLLSDHSCDTTALPTTPLSPLLCGVFCPFHALAPLQAHAPPEPPYPKTGSHLRQLNKNAVLNNYWWVVPSIEVHNTCSCQCFEKQKTFYTLVFRDKYSRKFEITVQCVSSTFHTMVHNRFSRLNSAKSFFGQSLWLILDLILFDIDIWFDISLHSVNVD